MFIDIQEKSKQYEKKYREKNTKQVDLVSVNALNQLVIVV